MNLVNKAACTHYINTAWALPLHPMPFVFFVSESNLRGPPPGQEIEYNGVLLHHARHLIPISPFGLPGVGGQVCPVAIWVHSLAF